MPALSLLADVIPSRLLALSFILLGAPGKVLAEGGGDARYIGIAAIITALFAGLVALVGAVASAVVKIRQSHRGSPSKAEVEAAEEILRRAAEANA